MTDTLSINLAVCTVAVVLKYNYGMPGHTLPTDAMKPLTRRELETLGYVAKGFTSRETATLMGVSKRTTDSCLGIVHDKLGVSNRVSAINKARELGLL